MASAVDEDTLRATGDSSWRAIACSLALVGDVEDDVVFGVQADVRVVEVLRRRENQLLRERLEAGRRGTLEVGEFAAVERVPPRRDRVELVLEAGAEQGGDGVRALDDRVRPLILNGRARGRLERRGDGPVGAGGEGQRECERLFRARPGVVRPDAERTLV